MSNNFKDLDPVLHSQARLSIVSLLMSSKSAEFSYLRDTLKMTAGNLSVQISNLEKAGYINVKKEFVDNYPCTTLSMTAKGIRAFEKYTENLKAYLNPK